MSERQAQLTAYLATLATLLLVFTAALLAAVLAPALTGKIEAFGLGTITGGLIGVLRLPQQRSDPQADAPADPAPNLKGTP